MMAALVDHVIGVDPDRDWITVAVVDAATTGVVDRFTVAANVAGYAEALTLIGVHSSVDRRVWSIEGAGSYGAGLAQAARLAGEWVVGFDRPAGRAAKDGAKSDALDAVRAARELLGRDHWAEPRARGEREAVRALLGSARRWPPKVRRRRDERAPLPAGRSSTACAASHARGALPLPVGSSRERTRSPRTRHSPSATTAAHPPGNCVRAAANPGASATVGVHQVAGSSLRMSSRRVTAAQLAHIMPSWLSKKVVRVAPVAWRSSTNRLRMTALTTPRHSVDDYRPPAARRLAVHRGPPAHAVDARRREVTERAEPLRCEAIAVAGVEAVVDGGHGVSEGIDTAGHSVRTGVAAAGHEHEVRLRGEALESRRRQVSDGHVTPPQRSVWLWIHRAHRPASAHRAERTPRRAAKPLARVLPSGRARQCLSW